MTYNDFWKKRGYKNMNYPFFCPNCGEKEIISMPIKEAHNDGHYCKMCNTELIREISSLVCRSIDTTGGFYCKNSI